MQKLVSHPDEQRNYSRRATRKQSKGHACSGFWPDVFVFGYASRQGDLVTANLQTQSELFSRLPWKPAFSTHMQGEMTVDIKQERLVALNGHLVEDVKFGGGLLGHLDKGGKFEVRQTEVAPGQWEMTTLRRGHERESSPVQDNRRAADRNPQRFHRVPDDLTLAEAAGILKGRLVVADNR